MDSELLQELGLNNSQSKVYLALIEKGALTPPSVAKITGESRTNAYMVLDKLEELGLVEEFEKSKVIHYQACNPVALERLTDEKRKKLTEVEQRVKSTMPSLLSYFYSFTERPGVRLLEGVDGLKEIYQDTLRAKQDIYFIRSSKSSEVKTLGVDYFDKYKKKRASLGITTYAFTQDIPEAQKHVQNDEKHLMKRTWISENDYTAPVEMNIYGNKIAFLSYGEEIMGVIIDSPPIADALRQIFNMINNT